jgi:hypothetical protein
MANDERSRAVQMPVLNASARCENMMIRHKVPVDLQTEQNYRPGGTQQRANQQHSPELFSETLLLSRQNCIQYMYTAVCRSYVSCKGKREATS